jgi:multidrug efflux system membrane fusion protein
MPIIPRQKEPPMKGVASPEGAPPKNPEANPLRTIVHGTPASAKKPAAAAPKQSWLLSLVILATLGGGIYYAYPRIKPYLTFSRPPAAAPPAKIIPVVTHAVDRADMDLYLNGLGTVTSFKTVTVRSRVEGELIKVAFTEGQMVHQGDLLAEIDPRSYQVQLKEAEAQLEKDKASLKLALLDYERYKSLVQSKTVTQQQVDTQKALVQETQATIHLDEGRINNAKLQLTYCHITSPIDGRIGLRIVDLGNLVRANDPAGLAVITQLQPIAVIFTIPQDDISRVQKKMLAGDKLVVEAFDRELKTKLATGWLAAIDNQVDSTTGTVRLKAVFPNEDNLLFPNQFVNGRLLIETLSQAVIVPSSAVQRGPNSMFAYVLQPDSTVDLRNIVVGPTEGDQTVIESGLNPGETVVIDGVDKLQKGTKVAARGSEAVSGGQSPPPKEEAAAKGT